MNNKYGFTLVEIIVVVSIIGLLSVLGINTFTGIQRRAHAAKMIADFQQIELAWKNWKNSHSGAWPIDNIYGIVNPDVSCKTDPSVADTDAKAYLENRYKNPWGIEYSYDNDGNTFPTNGIEGGVNILSSWCTGTGNGTKYLDIAPLIDAAIDDSDGSNLGKIRWNTDPNAVGSIIYMISVNQNQ